MLWCVGFRPRTTALPVVVTPVKGIPRFIYSIDGIFHQGYIYNMSWDIEYTDEFGQWWSSLSEDEQVSLAASVQLLEERGPALGFPHSSAIKGSKHSHMQHER